MLSFDKQLFFFFAPFKLLLMILCLKLWYHLTEVVQCQRLPRHACSPTGKQGNRQYTSLMEHHLSLEESHQEKKKKLVRAFSISVFPFSYCK